MQRTVERMLRTNPEPPFAPPDALSACIHACVECAQVSVACADACLGEHQADLLVRCIRLNLDCADVCEATSRMLSRQAAPNLPLIAMMLELCAAVCDASARECDRHAGTHAHCRVAAAACHRCFDACRTMVRGAPEARMRH